MDYCAFYMEHGGRRVSAVTLDGERFVGVLEDYTSAADNEPEPESIAIGEIELYTSDIAKIELLSDK